MTRLQFLHYTARIGVVQVLCGISIIIVEHGRKKMGFVVDVVDFICSTAQTFETI